MLKQQLLQEKRRLSQCLLQETMQMMAICQTLEKDGDPQRVQEMAEQRQQYIDQLDRLQQKLAAVDDRQRDTQQEMTLREDIQKTLQQVQELNRRMEQMLMGFREKLMEQMRSNGQGMRSAAAYSIGAQLPGSMINVRE